MKKSLRITKMSGGGNDFILVDLIAEPEQNALLRGGRLGKLAARLCDRRFGAGADGLLVLTPDRRHHFRMLYLNSDGSRARLCGNGGLCSAYYYHRHHLPAPLKFMTDSGPVEARVSGAAVNMSLSGVRGARLGIRLPVDGRILTAHFIDTGVPHAVLFERDLVRAVGKAGALAKMQVNALGRKIRFHRAFAPGGANVNFVKIRSPRHIRVRTYERGVEEETLSCGTGAAASAIIAGMLGLARPPVTVSHPGGNRVVNFEKSIGKTTARGVKSQPVKNVWLGGRVLEIMHGWVEPEVFNV